MRYGDLQNTQCYPHYISICSSASFSKKVSNYGEDRKEPCNKIIQQNREAKARQKLEINQIKMKRNI